MPEMSPHTGATLAQRFGAGTESLLRELRHAARSLARVPGVALVSLLALALGIGLTTMMFSIVYGALLRGLPFPDGDQIVAIQRTNSSRGSKGQPLRVHDYAEFRAQQHAFTDLAAFTSVDITLSGDDKAV